MDHLSHRLIQAFGLDQPQRRTALISLLHKLRGGPVSAGAYPELNELEGIELREGNICGLLLTHEPTDHRVPWGWTWCVFDALLLTELFDVPLRLSTTCIRSGVTVTISPEYTTPDMWISLPLRFEAGGRLRDDFCCCARAWVQLPSEAPGICFLTLEEAREVARDVARHCFFETAGESAAVQPRR